MGTENILILNVISMHFSTPRNYEDEDPIISLIKIQYECPADVAQ